MTPTIELTYHSAPPSKPPWTLLALDVQARHLNSSTHWFAFSTDPSKPLPSSQPLAQLELRETKRGVRYLAGYGDAPFVAFPVTGDSRQIEAWVFRLNEQDRTLRFSLVSSIELTQAGHKQPIQALLDGPMALTGPAPTGPAVLSTWTPQADASLDMQLVGELSATIPEPSPNATSGP